MEQGLWFNGRPEVQGQRNCIPDHWMILCPRGSGPRRTVKEERGREWVRSIHRKTGTRGRGSTSWKVVRRDGPSDEWRGRVGGRSSERNGGRPVGTTGYTTRKVLLSERNIRHLNGVRSLLKVEKVPRLVMTGLRRRKLGKCTMITYSSTLSRPQSSNTRPKTESYWWHTIIHPWFFSFVRVEGKYGLRHLTR